MIRTEKRMRICAAALTVSLAFIWGNSLLPGWVSGAFSDWVGKLLEAILPMQEQAQPTDGFLLRKLAHFTEFAVLGALLRWRSGMLRGRTVFAFLRGAAAACADETIQLFVPQRGPAVADVLLDCCGVAAGMVLVYLGHTWYVRKKHRS